MTATTVKESDIVSYYDTCQIDYQLVWQLESAQSMHYGFWDEATTSLKSALRNMNQLVADKAKIKPDQKVLDAGCGIGGTSLFLAKNYQCQIEGITLSKKQVAQATDLSSKLKLNHLSKFSVQDFCLTGFPDEHFDVIIAIESVCHANEKSDFLKEAFRLLKRNGCLVLCDFFRNRSDMNEEEDELILKWARSWAVPDFEYFEYFKEKAITAGFADVEQDNITKNILPSAKRLYRYFYPGLAIHYLLRAVGLRNKTHQANVWSTYYQYKALMRDLWSYHIFKVVKRNHPL